jgi:hypothetical protein
LKFLRKQGFIYLLHPEKGGNKIEFLLLHKLASLIAGRRLFASKRPHNYYYLGVSRKAKYPGQIHFKRMMRDQN